MCMCSYLLSCGMLLVSRNFCGVDLPIHAEDKVYRLLHPAFFFVAVEFVDRAPAIKVAENLCVFVCVFVCV